MRARRGETADDAEEEGGDPEEGEEPEEEGAEVVARINNITIETAGTEEEVGEELTVALEMEMEVEEEEGSEGEEWGGGTQRALEALEFLTQDAEPGGTTLVDARNGFNELSHLAMLSTVQHRWPAGARFSLNCYKHWAQLLLPQPMEPPVTILSREGVTQGDPLSMVLYGITLAPLAEDLRAVDLGLLSPFYADDTAFDGLARRSAQLLKLLMRRGMDWDIYPIRLSPSLSWTPRAKRQQRGGSLQLRD